MPSWLPPCVNEAKADVHGVWISRVMLWRLRRIPLEPLGTEYWLRHVGDVQLVTRVWSEGLPVEKQGALVRAWG